MKNSNIQWIGDIPDNWEIYTIKHLFKIGRGRVISELELVDDGKYPVYSSQTQNDGCMGYINTYDFDLQQLTWTTDGVYAGTVFIRSGKHNCTNVCGTLQLKDPNNNLLFIKYALEFIAVYHRRKDINGGKIMNNEMAQIKIPLPLLATQTLIATYLDSKCSEIDTLIADINKQIDTLNELKKSTITEAVTKGLNKNVKLKDSGIQWIGEIPENWKVTKFKYIATVKSNLVHPKDYSDYPQVAPDNIEKNSGKLLGYNSVLESGVISDNHLFYKGQIIYSKIRPTLNKVTIAPFDGLCSADMYPIETKHNVVFVKYLMLSAIFVSQVGIVVQDRVKMPKINQEELSAIWVIVPTLSEQQQIADYLDAKCSEFDAIISDKQKQISTLETYKKSLIYEYVTGKKEV